VTLATVVAAAVAILAVTAAVNGIAGISFAPLVAAAIVLAAVALHETAIVAARPAQSDP
jgi:hypothetical protein